MEIKKYLELCRKCSMLPIKMVGRRIIPNEFVLIYKDIKYYPVGYSMKFCNGKRMDIAFLHELHANSTREVLLEDVMDLTN